jgi:serine/threonine-protein kinase
VALSPGSTLGSYEILGPLGAGAMGEVYKARDSKLGREVAIKVLPEEFSRDEERLRRFEREARTLATLNHPNVAQIYGVDQIGDVCFLVLELVPGMTLADKIARGPLPLDEALEICRQITEGLEAAHEAGVIHRDLKPANVRVTPDGRVKVLDFGLAKPAGARGETKSTDSVLSTEQGRLLGTPTYMAPEQARGKPIDRRVDVWAFGCVFYECLTGTQAFAGETIPDVIGAVLHSDPAWSRLPPGTPAPLRQLLSRCLAKDPRQRLRDMGDARLALEEIDDVEPAPDSAPTWRRVLPWATTALLAVALVAKLLSMPSSSRTPTGSAVPLHLSVVLPKGTELPLAQRQEEQLLAISPDGSCLALIASSGGPDRLYLRRLGDPQVEPVAGTEDATNPFFSPDGRWIGFFARGRLKKVAIAGGQPIDLCAAGLSRGGAWGSDGTIVFSPSTTSGLMRVPSGGGTPQELTHLDPKKNERTHRWPTFLPGEEEVAFTIGTVDKPETYEDTEIGCVSLATGARRSLVQGASMVRFAPGGQMVLGRNDQLFAMPLAAAKGGPRPSAVPLLQGVNGGDTTGVVTFDIAVDGTLVYAERETGTEADELVWVGRDGKVEPLLLPLRPYFEQRISPDGKRIALGIDSGSGHASDIWVCDLPRGTLVRLTFDGTNGDPSWTPDGARVAYCTSAPKGDVFATRIADGSAAAETLIAFEDARTRTALGFSPDGKDFLFTQENGAGTSLDLMAIAVPDGRTRAVVDTPEIEAGGRISPDGRWLAYISGAPGRFGVYVQAFPGPGGRWQVTDDGDLPRWSPDGSELLYESGEKIMAVKVQSQPTFSYGAARGIIDLHSAVPDFVYGGFDVAPDGRILMVRRTNKPANARHVDVVLNWTAGLAREKGR